jgi:hypothetical protein
MEKLPDVHHAGIADVHGLNGNAITLNFLIY